MSIVIDIPLISVEAGCVMLMLLSSSSMGALLLRCILVGNNFRDFRDDPIITGFHWLFMNIVITEHSKTIKSRKLLPTIYT